MTSSLPPTDAALLDRIRAGDVAAFESLYRQHIESLWRIAYHYLQSRADAEDAVQSVFLRLWEIRERWAVRGRIDVYLYGAIRHEALQRLRHDRIVSRVASEQEEEIVEQSFAALPKSPDVVFDGEIREQAVSTAIQNLPERQKLAVTLRYTHNLGYQDIADVMGIAVSYAHKQVTLGEKALRRILDNLAE